MEKEYFYLNGETKVGPLSLEALKYAPITPKILVWTNTIPDWVEARTLPEVASLLNPSGTTPPAAPSFSPPPAAPVPPQQTPYNMGNYASPDMRPPMPENYLVWAILTTILCCLPLGIVSIISATKVSTLYAQGDYEGANKASADAKKWAMWSAISAGILIFLYIIFIVILGAAGLMDM
jgi:hypothetical protein